jgi:hypothetical protein
MLLLLSSCQESQEAIVILLINTLACWIGGSITFWAAFTTDKGENAHYGGLAACVFIFLLGFTYLAALVSKTIDDAKDEIVEAMKNSKEGEEG